MEKHSHELASPLSVMAHVGQHLFERIHPQLENSGGHRAFRPSFG